MNLNSNVLLEKRVLHLIKKKEIKKPLEELFFGMSFYRKDRINIISCKLKKIPIKKNMAWCDDPKSKFYNKLVKLPFKYRHEKMFRKDKKYDLVIPINYNSEKILKNKGSAIFIHLTKNYKKTLGCIALKERDMLILLRLINKKTKIKII